MTVSVKAPTSTTGSIQLNGSDVLTIDSSGNLTAPNNLTVTGTVTQTGGATFNGGITGNVAFDTDTLYVDATNNRVGIGTTTPSTALDINGYVSFSSGANRRIMYRSANNDILYEFDSGDFYLQSIANSSHLFYVGNANRVAIESSVTAIGKAGAYNGLEVYNVSGGTNVYRSITGGGIIHFFSDVGGTKALKSYINETGGLTSASDYRLKENIIPVDNATETIKLLNPVHFNFIGLDKQQSGFIAHELKDVIPHIVDGDKDQLKEDGTPFIQMVDHTKLIPYLTKALQEAITKIEDLETRIQALENPNG